MSEKNREKIYCCKEDSERRLCGEVKRYLTLARLRWVRWSWGQLAYHLSGWDLMLRITGLSVKCGFSYL